MSADPHYWLGWLAFSISRALKAQDPVPDLRRDLQEFLRSEAATARLRALLREESTRA